MRKFLCFIHIERCGGTSMHHILRYNFPSFLALKPRYYWANERGTELKLSELATFKKLLPFLSGISGHNTRLYYGYENIIGNEIFYFTFFRNPLKRYISHYNFQNAVMKKNWNFDDFILEHRFDNFITSRIAGKPDLEIAKRLLRDKLSFVGITEKFEESLFYFVRQLGISKLIVCERQINEVKPNKNRYNTLTIEDLNENQLQKVRANNEIDLMLYDYAYNEFF